MNIINIIWAVCASLCTLGAATAWIYHDDRAGLLPVAIWFAIFAALFWWLTLAT